MNRLFILLLITVAVLGDCGTNNITYVESWPDPELKFGQISAVCLDVQGNVYVFHRGKHVWDLSTFSYNNSYLKVDEGPIYEDTVVVLNKSTGGYLNSWGRRSFYIPHGLTVDRENNVWLTDVALHQVFKFSSNGTRFFTLGEKFVNRQDNEHFCKPTSVAVLSNGDFFVADGYCNSRIMKFSSSGNFLSKWGTPNLQRISIEKQPQYSFNVPHALTLVENSNQICVADRENGRILCFDHSTGKFAAQYRFLKATGPRLFSLCYTPADGGLFYVVNGPPYDTFYNVSVAGFVISLTASNIVNIFEPGYGNFANPHDIAVSEDGSDLYVVEINPYRVHKFAINNRGSCKKEVEKEESHAQVSRSENGVTAVIVVVLTAAVLFLGFVIYRFCLKGRKKYKKFDFDELHSKNEEINMQLM